MTHAFDLNGLKLESDFPLPAFAAWDGSRDALADITICRGKVPSRLDRPKHVGPLFQTGAVGEYLLVLPGTGRFLIRDGCEIAVELEFDTPATNLSAILSGPI